MSDSEDKSFIIEGHPLSDLFGTDDVIVTGSDGTEYPVTGGVFFDGKLRLNADLSARRAWLEEHAEGIVDEWRMFLPLDEASCSCGAKDCALCAVLTLFEAFTDMRAWRDEADAVVWREHQTGKNALDKDGNPSKWLLSHSQRCRPCGRHPLLRRDTR